MTVVSRADLDGGARGPHARRVTDKPKQQPQRSAAGESMTAEREARLAAALRANLQRRKAQARERQEIPRSRDDTAAEKPPHPSPLPTGEREGPA